jgi:hypothetical protein
MQFVLYTIAALALYFFSDWILVRIEKSRGEPLKYRSVIFFAIIMVLSILSFKAIEILVKQ